MSKATRISMNSTNKAVNRLNNNANQVIAARLALLPWQWLMDPEEARRETNRMFSEKHDALLETQMALAMLPMTLWTDFWRTGGLLTPVQAMNRAASTATRTILKPMQSRVSANLKRLT
tara:strand:- start:40 stop:396 length:357 start_codon:yes stop_codon:yes gene_type:complete